MKLNQELMKYTLLTAIGYDLADSKYLGQFSYEREIGSQ